MPSASIITGVTLVILIVTLVYFSKKPKFPAFFLKKESYEPGFIVILLPIVTWAIFVKFYNINYSFFAQGPKIIVVLILTVILSFFITRKT